MIEITINNNSDEIRMRSSCTDISLTFKEYQNKEYFLLELLNVIASEADDRPDIKLTKIDEDTETTIEEW